MVRNTRRLDPRHRRMWADEVVDLIYRLIVINKLEANEATTTHNIVRFHGLIINKRLPEEELRDT